MVEERPLTTLFMGLVMGEGRGELDSSWSWARPPSDPIAGDDSLPSSGDSGWPSTASTCMVGTGVAGRGEGQRELGTGVE